MIGKTLLLSFSCDSPAKHIMTGATATGLSLEEIYEKLGIPKNVPKSTQMKEISKIAEGFEFDAAKEKAEGTKEND